MKRKILYSVIFLTNFAYVQMFAVNVAGVLQVIQAASGKTGGGSGGSGGSGGGASAQISATAGNQQPTIVPKPTQDIVKVQPQTAAKLLPGTITTLAIPAAITGVVVNVATNVGDVYTGITFTQANVTSINAAIAKGTSLQMGCLLYTSPSPRD